MSRVSADVRLEGPIDAPRGGVWRYPADDQGHILSRPARATGWVRLDAELLITSEDPTLLRLLADALLKSAAELDTAQEDFERDRPD